MTSYVSTEELKRNLLDIVDFCVANGVATRLSTIGLLLSKRMKAPFRSLSPEPTLATFIRTHMAGEVDIIPDPNHRLVLHIIRKSHPENTLEEAHGTELAEESVGKSVVASIAETRVKPRFHRSFWAAFSKPALTGKTRFIQMTPPFHFVDIDHGSPTPDGYAVIDDNFIAPGALEQGPERSKFVFTQIEAWLQKVGRSPDLFLQPKLSFPTEASTPLFVNLLAKLDDRDLERIAIPADVWLKLLKLG